MRSAINRINHRFHQMKPGSVLILVVALLVLMALIGTAFLSSGQVDRYTTQQNTTNTEIALLVEGVKNMAKATIVGSLYDSSQVTAAAPMANTFRPANSPLYHNWTAPDSYHQYTNDPNIGTLANDAWLSPRIPSLVTPSSYPLAGPATPTDPPTYSALAGAFIPVWSSISQPAVGKNYESPFVQQQTAAGSWLNVSTEPLIWYDRVTAEFAPPTTTNGGVPFGTNITVVPVPNNPVGFPAAVPNSPPQVAPHGSQLTPSFATINYPDGTSATFPAFVVNLYNSAAYYLGTAVAPTYVATCKYLAGDADGDGIADCGMFRLSVGQLNGLTYYAGWRIVDNNSAVDVTQAMSRRYDFDGNLSATRYWNAGAATNAFSTGVFNLGCFPNNIGLAEMLHSYNGTGTTLFTGAGSLGSEFAAWTLARLNAISTPIPGIMTVQPPTIATLSGAKGPVTEDGSTNRTDFAYTTFGDMLYSQLGRRPEVPGYVGVGTQCVAASPADAAGLAYHFVLTNPANSPSPLETTLTSSIYTSAPNQVGNTSIVKGASSYSSLNGATAVAQWYKDNFDWDGLLAGTAGESCMTIAGANSATAAATDLPRRSILTGLSATSNIVPLPQTDPTNPLPFNSTMAANAPLRPMLSKTSVNTASPDELWRAFWLVMTSDYGKSALGDDATVASSTANHHKLQLNQSIYTGSQFNNPTPAGVAGLDSSSQIYTSFKSDPSTDPQHPQRMFRSVLRTPGVASAPYTTYYGVGNYNYIEGDQMAVLRSAIASANTQAMRDPIKGTGATIHTMTVPLKATIKGVVGQPVTATVYGVPKQPYITEVFADTDVTSSFGGDTNSKAYIAIELFNPYNEDLDLTGWKIAYIDRTGTTYSSTGHYAAPTVIATIGSSTVTTYGSNVIPHYSNPPATGTVAYKGGYMLLENVNPNGSGDATTRPPASQIMPAKGDLTRKTGTGVVAPLNDMYVPGLDAALNHELVLLRPAGATDTMPVDSYDFTGLMIGSATNADAWHYVRGNGSTADGSQNSLWRFIYPGRYDASDPAPYSATASAIPLQPTDTTVLPNPGDPSDATHTKFSAYTRRQEGTQAENYNPTAAPEDPFRLQSPTPPPSMGSATPTNDNITASYVATFPFQYLNDDQPSPSPINATINNYPFGQFARNSDLLQIPFVGAYRIVDSGGNLIELNAMPMDCSFAEDTDLSDDPPTTDVTNTAVHAYCESVGHFAPINNPTPVNGQVYADGDPSLVNTDYATPPDTYAPYKTPAVGSVANTWWRYHWASKLFDYLTVQNPNDDYAPNVAPALYPTATPPVGVVNSFVSATAGISTSLTIPHIEDTVPVYGKINLNTAPWRVLAALRFCPYDDADTTATDSATVPISTHPAQCVYDTTVNPPVFRKRLAASATGYVAAIDGAALVPDNVLLAKAITDWRDRYGSASSVQAWDNNHTASNAFNFVRNKGPFDSLTDLFQVPAVQTYIQLLALNTAGAEPDVNFGHLSPAFKGGTPILTDGVRNDVEERYDLLDRISNQATVRSDTFTVYIVVQGWRNAGSTSTSAPPQLVTQRRAAFFVDRSSVNPTNTEPRVYPIPQE